MIKPVILIADDDLIVRQTVRQCLSADYQVIEASNGSIAVDVAIKSTPSLILLDIMMPVMDGYEACYKLKHNDKTKNIPLLMLTALEMELNRKLADSFGANGYVTKPFDLKCLKSEISNHLKG